MLVEAPSGIQIEEIVSATAFQELRPEWENLWRRCLRATPFQSPHWLLPWWKHFGGSGLWCLAVRAGGELVGLVPCFIWDRKLLLIGTGITDYLDALIDPEWEAISMAAIMPLLTQQSHHWDQCDFQQLRANSSLCGTDAAVQDVCPVLDLSTPDVPMLKKAAYYLRHAANFGTVRIEAAAEQNFERCFSEFLRLHQLRWKNEAVLKEADLKTFHYEVAFQFLRLAALRLYVLYLDRRAIAAWYGFESHRRVYYYLGGFDPAFEKLSPGAILIAHAIRQAREHGAREFDFLRGQERYKYSWGAHDTFTYRRQSV